MHKKGSPEKWASEKLSIGIFLENGQIPTLQEMDFMKYEGKGYQPTYTRTSLTDDLHEAFGFCTSKQIVPVAKMRNIISNTKK